MQLNKAVLLLALGSALALAACGDDDNESSPAAEEQGTPAQAIQEIAAVRAGLDQALQQVRSGDRKAAEETVSETYLQHFEKVEGPLDKVDHELNEELEHTIREELKAKAGGSASAADVQKLVTEVKADLATAEAKLK